MASSQSAPAVLREPAVHGVAVVVVMIGHTLGGVLGAAGVEVLHLCQPAVNILGVDSLLALGIDALVHMAASVILVSDSAVFRVGGRGQV